MAEFLAQEAAVARVYYPLFARPSRPSAGRPANARLRRDGLACELAGGAAAARQVVTATQIFALAESLGGVESLIEVPAPMTHASVAGSALEIAPGLVRLSVGIEHSDDLLADLQQALEQT